ncbi:hypothetical protein OFN62_33885, partial [Escherichia coli]|nr:hypothetical protein [Escherichia coli]
FLRSNNPGHNASSSSGVVNLSKNNRNSPENRSFPEAAYSYKWKSLQVITLPDSCIICLLILIPGGKL